MNAHDPQLSPPPPKHATEADRLIGLRLTALRKARGLSQAALGAAVGITFQQIQKYERGRNRIGAGRLQTFARIFEVRSRPSSRTQGDELSGEPAEVFGFLRERVRSICSASTRRSRTRACAARSSRWCVRRPD